MNERLDPGSGTGPANDRVWVLGADPAGRQSLASGRTSVGDVHGLRCDDFGPGGREIAGRQAERLKWSDAMCACTAASSA